MNARIYFVCLVVCMFFSLSFAEDVIEIRFTIDRNDNFRIDKMYIIDGSETAFETTGPYRIELLNDQGEVLRAMDFDVDFILYTDPPRPIDESKGVYKIKYYKSATLLRVKHNNKVIYSESIKNKFCNKDRVCNNYENIISCPQDCTASSKDGYCVSDNKDGICDPDCTYFQDDECPDYKTCSDDVCFSPMDEKRKICFGLIGTLMLVVLAAFYKINK